MAKAKKKQEPLREAKVVETPELEDDRAYVADDSMLMPMDGNAFETEEQEDVKQERTEDQLLMSGNPAIIDAVFEWLEAEMNACDSVEATLILADARGMNKEQALEAMSYVRKIFLAKKVSFENIRDTLKA